jgi:hypothetical protein
MIVLARMSGPRVLGRGSRVHLLLIMQKGFPYHASLDKCFKGV